MARSGRRRAARLLPVAVGVAVAVAAGVRALVAFAPLPSGEPSALRRRTLLATVFGGAAGTAAAGAQAFELESNRQAAYVDKARKLNEAADWYLFELRPLVYPPANILAISDCEAMGDNCPERASLSVISNMYQRPPQTRSAATLSKPERDIIAPMRQLATSSVFDPDTGDELAAGTEAFEATTAKFQSAARRGDLKEVRRLYDQGREELNKYFKKVNAETSLAEDNDFYLRLLPADQATLDNERYWQRRQQKWLTKKKVDAMSKGSKTVRFYAKSIYGDDAVSWDPRGDRAEEFSMAGGSS